MTDPAPKGRRRRRPHGDPPPHTPPDGPAEATAPRGRREPTDRGLRDLVGAGPSQLGVEGALRGRDVNRPSDEDIAAAERDIVVVRRHWTPPAAH